jgi:hypothetical protein
MELDLNILINRKAYKGRTDGRQSFDCWVVYITYLRVPYLSVHRIFMKIN